MSALTAFGASEADSQQESSPSAAQDDFQLLFIGNSHVRVGDLPGLITTMIETGLPGSRASYEIAPGYDYLADRLADGVTQSSLESRSWTHVILQAQKYSTSGLYIYPTDGAEEWIRRVRARNAEPILFPEWRRRGNTWEGRMVHNLHLGIASREPACVAPVGLAWEEIIGRYPSLDLHAGDGNHANANGAALTAFVFYQVITGLSAAELPFIQGIDVSESTQRNMREIASEVVVDNSETCTYNQDIPDSVDVKAGDIAGLINAISKANAGLGPGDIRIVAGDNGESGFEFSGPAPGFDSALPDGSGNIRISGFEGLVFRPAEDAVGMFRFLRVTGGKLALYQSKIEGFGVSLADGGAIEVQGNGKLELDGVDFHDNASSANGGAIAVTGGATLTTVRSLFSGNIAGMNGGAINAEATSAIEISRGRFQANDAGLSGCDISISSSASGRPALLVQGSQFTSSCSGSLIDNPSGFMRLLNNTFYSNSDHVNSTGKVEMQGNVFQFGTATSKSLRSAASPPRKQALCDDFDSGAFESLGYNIASDDNCTLDQPTDMAGVDAMILGDADGLYQAQPGSPVIDSGLSTTVLLEEGGLVSLPCGYRDLAGTARPQDSNGDGIFECDIGALEKQGDGEIAAGHSGAFYNIEREGEGNFVEILSETRALVYTLSYRPDGSGPAWFVGLGTIRNNAIVIDQLTRPIGTSFGSGFNKGDVVRTPVGGMSMVFPDCTAADPGGNVAYSGDAGLGYEGLITRATRLTNVTGCSDGPAHENVGLSGSYFDPARDGEGIVVQWLPDGRVLAVFFTYDLNNNQMWVLGIGRASGKSVSIDARYPSSSSLWGSEYFTADAIQSDWGTITLDWTDCNSVAFHYDSVVEGYGSATRNYVRLTTLQDTSCPGF